MWSLRGSTGLFKLLKGSLSYLHYLGEELWVHGTIRKKHGREKELSRGTHTSESGHTLRSRQELLSTRDDEQAGIRRRSRYRKKAYRTFQNVNCSFGCFNCFSWGPNHQPSRSNHRLSAIKVPEHLQYFRPFPPKPPHPHPGRTEGFKRASMPQPFNLVNFPIF